MKTWERMQINEVVAIDTLINYNTGLARRIKADIRCIISFRALHYHCYKIHENSRCNNTTLVILVSFATVSLLIATMEVPACLFKSIDIYRMPTVIRIQKTT
jgi:hypothetical protein